MEPVNSEVLTASPKDNHDLTKNLVHCICNVSVNPNMDYFYKIHILVVMGSGKLPTMDILKC